MPVGDAVFDPAILDEVGTVLLDDRDVQVGRGRTLLFAEPWNVLTCATAAGVPELLARLDAAIGEGLWAAGYIAYDAGLPMAGVPRPRHRPAVPVVWLGLYDAPVVLDSETLDLGPVGLPDEVSAPALNISREEYTNRVTRILEYVAAGDIYQANYTCKLRFRNAGRASRLFARLRAAHPVGFSAFVNTGGLQVASLSPELFLRRRGRHIVSRPMKGTVRRGRWVEEDAALARFLGGDPKNRAENLMIVDLMRNDLGRVCEVGTVHVPRLFHVEPYGTLFQMTSDVAGLLPEEARASEVLAAAFPPGSVTGAPKIRAMEIIDETEAESRGVYCGCVGAFGPGGEWLLNVAIRTVVQVGEECEMGVGSGIVADSDPAAEHAETLLKGRFLGAALVGFELLETLRYTAGQGCAYLDEHLARMAASAGYFAWRFPEAAVRAALAEAAEALEARAADLPHGARVRLLVGRDGAARWEWAALEAPATGPVSLLLARRRTDPADVFLCHKTTRRRAYDDDWRAARERGFLDLVYLNTRGEVTEGAVSNIVVRRGGRWVTPPLECGLLPGIWRREMLESGRAEEGVLGLEDLRRAEAVMVGNSVRGSVEVGLIVAEGEGADGASGEAIFEAHGAAG